MIPEAFLIAALALPVLSTPKINPFQFGDSREDFLREYDWIKGILEKTYPGHEFKIVPQDLNITRIVGWERIEGLYWRGHSLFKRKKPNGAA